MSEIMKIRNTFRELKQSLNLLEEGKEITFDSVRKLIKSLESSVASYMFYNISEDDDALPQIRYDLKCDACGESVKDQRALKADKNEPMFDTRKPDFKCTNYNHCSGGYQGDRSWVSKGWFLNGKNSHPIPEEWKLFG